MPFKVQFDIRSKYQVAVTTFDRQYAYIKYNEYFKKDPCTSLRRTVTPTDLTGPEKFLYLAYQVFEAKQRYFEAKGREQEDIPELRKVFQDLQTQLDLQIAVGRYYLNTHPKSSPDEEALTFFLAVESWRKHMSNYRNYKKASNSDKAIIGQMYRQGMEYETKINKYISLVSG